jgi:UDP-N-acetylglucosamine--N-acetylmuramyl-(pentapeptide) pyrophosphoryl-undecaprenol N-acetylglucosamine transferase
MSRPEYIFAGGGTGGHLYPGLAVAAALRRLQPDAKITFLTTSRKLDRDLLSRTDYSQIPQVVRPFSVRPWHWPGFWLAWRRSIAAARGQICETGPAAVIGLGGYAAGPPVVAARSLGVRTAILNPDAVPGRANRFLARRADLIAQQWDVSGGYFPAGAPCRTLGCPIRAEFADAARSQSTYAEQGRRTFELAANRRVLLVTGASLGARSVNESVQRVWPEFVRNHPEWQLLHLAGRTDEAAARQAYERAGVPRESVRVVGYAHEMWLAIAAADAVVSRAGASTLAELTALGKPSILMPYPYHRDKHQHANARVLVEAGAAILVDDQKDAAKNHAPLLSALEELSKSAQRDAMARAAQKLARPDAAEAVAQWMVGTGKV